MHIGQMLLANGTITQEQLEQALALQEEVGGHLGHILVKLGFVEERMLTEFLAKQLDKPVYWLDDPVEAPECLKLFAPQMLRQYMALPLKKEMGSVLIAMADPEDFAAVDTLRMQCGMAVETVLAPQSRIFELLDEWTRGTNEEKFETKDEKQEKKHRHGLSGLVNELKGDSAAGDDAAPKLWSQQPTRELLLRVTATLIQKGLLDERDLAD